MEKLLLILTLISGLSLTGYGEILSSSGAFSNDPHTTPADDTNPVIKRIKPACKEGNTGSITLVDRDDKGFEYALLDESNDTLKSGSTTKGVIELKNLRAGAFAIIVETFDHERDTLHANVHALSPLVMKEKLQSPTTEVSKDGSIALEVTKGDSPFSIAWSHSEDQTFIIDGLTAGAYGCIIYDAEGCAYQRLYQLEAMQPVTALLETVEDRPMQLDSAIRPSHPVSTAE